MAGLVGELHALLGDHREVALLQVDDVAGVREDGGDVGSDEVAMLAETHHQRARVLGDDQHLGKLLGDDGQRVGSSHVAERCAHRLGKLQSLLDLHLDQVGEDLGVGLGAELVPRPRQRLLQLEMIFDDPVVDHRHAAVLVRVRVLVGRLAVRGPAGVADAGGALRHRLAEALLQIRQLALGPHHRQAVVAEDGDAGRIVSAVLQLPQPLDQQACALLIPDVSHDAAHDPGSP